MEFRTLDDMISFLRGFRPLFPEESADKEPGTEAEEAPAVDKEMLRKIREETEETKTVWPEEISRELKKVVFGQDEVMDALAQKIVINRTRKEKKLLSIGLLGPTGTGKSETGKALADILTKVYGKKFGFIDVKANQMVGEHSVHSFFGAPPGYVGHGAPTLLDPVKKNPNHVIVIEEVEKANQTVLTGLMEAIDTGFLDMADNTAAIDLNSCILLFTSNIPVNAKEYREASDFLRGELCRDAFTKHCGRPEISGKIGNFVVFNLLSDEARADIIVKFIRQELLGYDLTLQTIDPYLMNEFLSHETKYGARPLLSLVSDAIGAQLLKRRMVKKLKGKRVSMSGTLQHIIFDIDEGG